MQKLTAVISLSLAAFGQTFESASVKVSSTAATSSHLVEDPERFECLYCNVRSLIALAYRTIPSRVMGPNWIGSKAIDVLATKPPNTSEENQRLMLQALLAERFHLVVHRGGYDVTAYNLGVAKGGPKLKLANSHSNAESISKLKGPARTIVGALSIETLAFALQVPLESLVTNTTGLPGTFEILLQWSPEDAIAADLPEATFPPLAMALEQQLGLKLNPIKVKIETLVVDAGREIPEGI
jgi:bla regulator protein blaR1